MWFSFFIALFLALYLSLVHLWLGKINLMPYTYIFCKIWGMDICWMHLSPIKCDADHDKRQFWRIFLVGGGDEAKSVQYTCTFFWTSIQISHQPTWILRTSLVYLPFPRVSPMMVPQAWMPSIKQSHWVTFFHWACLLIHLDLLKNKKENFR